MPTPSLFPYLMKASSEGFVVVALHEIEIIHDEPHEVELDDPTVAEFDT